MRRGASTCILGMGLACLVFAGGCTLTAPVDPAGLTGTLGGLLDDVSNAVENAVEDPLGVKPYPVVIGGDSERVFYATDLSESLIRFPGPTNDLVIPGFLGPANVYKHEHDERTLLRPLVPGSTVFGLTTNGESVAYVRVADIEARVPHMQVLVGGLFLAEDRVVFETSEGEWVFEIRLHGALLAILVGSESGSRIVLINTDDGTRREIAEAVIHDFDLRDRRLAYIAGDRAGAPAVLIRDLTTDVETEVARGLRLPARVFLTDNFVVWTDNVSENVERVWAYELATGERRLWADAVEGTVSGASDEYFVAQETRLRDNGSSRLIVRLYDLRGNFEVLGEFPADGRAGQAQVRGRRVFFVNNERRVVVVPLGEGRRFNFRPF